MMSDAINQLAELLDSSDAIPVFRHTEVHAAFRDLQQQLDAANQRIEELTEQRNIISGHFSHLEMCRDNATVRADAVERKLATARGALRYYANQDNWDVLPKLQTSSGADCLQINEGIGYAVAVEALAQIEQP
jgi:TolA-binding protein